MDDRRSILPQMFGPFQMARLILLATLALSAGCAPSDSGASAVSTEAPVETERVAGFDNPNITCDALASEGFDIMPRTRWNPELVGSYGCTSEEVIVTAGFPLDNTLQFYAEGTDSGEAVEFARITADVFMPEASAAVLGRLAAVSGTFAQYLASESPTELAGAAEAGEAATVPLGEYVAEVTREPYNQGYGVIVTFRRAP